MSIGATLQQARAARKLTVEQLARRTRIPLRIIEAMEKDEWAKVPPGIFARGYLRAYAGEVGLDGNALAAQFDAEQAPPPAPEDAAPPAVGLARPVILLRWPALPEEARHWLAGPAFVALLVLVYLAGRLSTSDGRPGFEPVQSPAPVATATTGSSAEESPPVATSSAAPAAASRARAPAAGTVPSADAPLELDVEATRACWVTASADATRVIYRVLQPGERVQARGRVLTLRVGDAGALRLTVEREPAKPLGASGEVVTVRITRENYRSLLTSHSGN